MIKSNLKIILLYDNDEDLKKLKSFIEARYHIVLAATIEETFEQIYSFQPHIIIIPLELKTVDGRQLIKQLLMKAHNFEVIVLSRKKDSKDAMVLNKMGVYSYLNSPISIQQLLFSISQIEEKLLSPTCWQVSQFIEIERLRRSFLIALMKHNAQSALITSATSGEGKTFLLQNLVRNLAKNYHNKFLLIDVNHYRPKLHEYFHLDNRIGFTDYLLGGTDWQRLIRNTEYTNLKMITSGKPIQPQTNAPNAEKLKELISQSKLKFDLVLFDCPSVQQYNRFNIDPLSLSRIVDCNFLIVLIKKTLRQDLASTLSEFERVGSQVHGLFLNNLLIPKQIINWKKILTYKFLTKKKLHGRKNKL